MKAKYDAAIETQRQGWMVKGGLSATEAEVFAEYSWDSLPERAKAAVRKYLKSA